VFIAACFVGRGARNIVPRGADEEDKVVAMKQVAPGLFADRVVAARKLRHR
jgi:hypothetical protein